MTLKVDYHPEWALPDGQRQETVERMAKNISALAFFRGSPIADDVVAAAAAVVEKKAYTVARVEARTTTGVRCCRFAAAAACELGRSPLSALALDRSSPPTPARRPHHETLKAYIRKLSALALEVVQAGGSLEGGGVSADGEVGAAVVVYSRPAWPCDPSAATTMVGAADTPLASHHQIARSRSAQPPLVMGADRSSLPRIPTGAGPARLARLHDQGDR